MRGSVAPSSRAADAVTVRAVGSGGVEEARGFLDDQEVVWALLRMEVGSGAFARTKFVAVHFNGEDVPVVRRGRLNSHSAEVMQHFGEVHATLQYKRREEFTVHSIFEELLPVLTADTNLEGVGGGLSASSLKLAYEARIAEQKKAASRTSLSTRNWPRTARECGPGRRPSASSALAAVAQSGGMYNWVLLEPSKLELHNAGYGGLDEFKAWLEDDKVLFGVIRFSFGQMGAHQSSIGLAPEPDYMKFVFVHWIGPGVPAVRRGQWNMQQGEADSMVAKASIAIALRKEVHAPNDLEIGQLVAELQQVPSDGTDDAVRATLSVATCISSLEEECRRGMEADVSDGEDEAAPQVLPDVRAAVDGVRKAEDGGWNWMLLGLGPQTPSQQRLSVSGPRRSWAAPAEPPVAPANSAAPSASLTATASRPPSAPVPQGPSAALRAGNSASQGDGGRAAGGRRQMATVPQVKAGSLRLRTGWWWSRRHFQLRAGHLKWWRFEKDAEREADPLGEIALVEGETRWRVEHVEGSRLEVVSNGDGRAGGKRGERYLLEADDESDCVDWAEAIKHHIRYVDMLLCWPLPLEGRQGDIRSYGVSYPDDVR